MEPGEWIRNSLIVYFTQINQPLDSIKNKVKVKNKRFVLKVHSQGAGCQFNVQHPNSVHTGIIARNVGQQVEGNK